MVIMLASKHLKHRLTRGKSALKPIFILLFYDQPDNHNKKGDTFLYRLLISGQSGARTLDPRIKSPLLYQLS